MYLFLIKKVLSVAKKDVVIESGTNELNESEILFTAARWHGYTILVGFEPVRNTNQMRFTRMNKTRLFLNFSLVMALELKCGQVDFFKRDKTIKTFNLKQISHSR